MLFTEEMLSRRATNHDGPSASLRELFARLGLSERAWRAAAKRHLRDIAGDLPLFDSAWIDACVCDRRLTPWQADVLNSSHPDRLFVGPCVVKQPLAVTPFGTVYEATQADTNRAVELLRLEVPASERAGVESRLHALIEHGRGSRPESVQYPRGLIVDGDAPVVAFARCDGVTIHDAIIRRGRIPADVVTSVANQLLDLVDRLERSGSCHGDIRAQTVRVDPEGRVALAACGVRSAVEPVIQYRVSMRPEASTGIAPERIGTNVAASADSDRYAVGCLLWEMLAGRPITPHGSALGCLRAHLERDLAPLGDFAPDAPKPLNDLIARLLSRSPEDRRVAASHDVKIVRLRHHSITPRTIRSGSRLQRPSKLIAATAASLLAAAGIWTTLPALQSQLTDGGSVAQTLPIDGPGPIEAAVAKPSGPAAMPTKPTADGTLMLPPGRVRAGRVVWPGPLHLIGAEDGTTEVIVEQPWELFADTVSIKRLTIRSVSAGDAVLDVHSQDFSLKNTRVSAGQNAAAIQWAALDSGDMTGRTISVEQTRIDGMGHAFALGSDVSRLTMTDSLVTTFGAVASWNRWPRSPGRIDLDHVTVRGVASLINSNGRDVGRGQRVTVSIMSSLIEPTGGALATVFSDQATAANERLLVEANQSVATEDWTLTPGGPTTPIAVGTLTFTGELDGDDRASVLLSADVPLSVDNWPGVRRSSTVNPAVNEKPRVQETASEETADAVGTIR